MSDISQLEQFHLDLLTLANRTLPKESKKFLKTHAKKLVPICKKTAKTLVKKKTGNYSRAFKAGKPYVFNGDLSCRTFNGSPHAHLIEYGHVQHSNDGEKFVEGRHVFKKATEAYEPDYVQACEDFIADVIEGELTYL